MEELEPSECLTSPRRRHVHFATLYRLGMDGIRKFERLFRAFPKRPKVKISKVFFGAVRIASQFIQLFDASQGLEYMHGLDCVHGDLKSVS